MTFYLIVELQITSNTTLNSTKQQLWDRHTYRCTHVQIEQQMSSSCLGFAVSYGNYSLLVNTFTFNRVVNCPAFAWN